MDWAKVEQGREQLVLFPTRLDEAIGPRHRVRLFDEILARLDWSIWEAEYDLRRGQPPIHPKILASVILYGLLVRIRPSRSLPCQGLELEQCSTGSAPLSLLATSSISIFRIDATLEEALQVRMDFRWLVERRSMARASGRTIVVMEHERLPNSAS